MLKHLPSFRTNPLVAVRSLQNDLLTVLTSYLDLYATRSNIEAASSIREAAMLHVLNHISKSVGVSTRSL